MAVSRLGNFDPFPGRERGYALYCLHGENDALIRARLQALRETFAAEGLSALVELDGEAIAREPFLLADELGSLSLFAERRFIRVTLGAKSADAAVANVLPRLADARDVVMAIDAGGDARHEDVVRLLSREPRALVVRCDPDAPADLAAWAGRTLSEAGVDLDADALRELVDLAAQDRAHLANELTKLALLAADGPPVDRAAMRLAVADSAALVVDEAIASVFAGDLRAAAHAVDLVDALPSGPATFAGAALWTALKRHRSAPEPGPSGAAARRLIALLADLVQATRSDDRLADAKIRGAMLAIAARSARR